MNGLVIGALAFAAAMTAAWLTTEILKHRQREQARIDRKIAVLDTVKAYRRGGLGPYPDGLPRCEGRLPRRSRARHVDRLVLEIETQQRVARREEER